MYLQEAKADAHQGPAQVKTPQNALQNTVPAVTTGDPEVDKKIKNLKKVWRDSFPNRQYFSRGWSVRPGASVR